MKGFILKFFITLSSLIFFISFNCFISENFLNINKVIKNINFISSDSFKGRLAGTKENNEAANYIMSEFKSYKLKPYEDHFLDKFSTPCPVRIEGTPRLYMENNKSQVIEVFQYGIDYKEDMLNFKVNKFESGKEDKITYGKSYITLTKGNSSVMFYAPNDDNLNFRSSFIYDSPYDLYISIKNSCLESIKENLKGGNKLNVEIPIKNEIKDLYNVEGYIKGKDANKPPLILSAHFDHVGTDLNNNIYNGSLDNASGTSFMLELVDYFSKLPVPDRDIIFIGFNAEELGLRGSYDFVSKNKDKLKNAKVYNFDMIGGEKKFPLCVMGGSKDTGTQKLIKDTTRSFDKKEIYYTNMFDGASDHEYFRKAGIDAITLCDNDLTYIHTPLDTISKIDSENINRCFNGIKDDLIAYSYEDNPYMLYSKEIALCSGLVLLLFSIKALKKTR